MSFDFLNHLDGASREAGADRALTDISQDWRYSIVTQPPATLSFSVVLPDRPVLRFSIGRRWVPCQVPGSFQVWIQPADGANRKIYERVLQAPNPRSELGWFDEELELDQYAAEPVQVTLKSEFLGTSQTCDWFLWGDPRIIALPAEVPLQSK